MKTRFQDSINIKNRTHKDSLFSTIDSSASTIYSDTILAKTYTDSLTNIAKSGQKKDTIQKKSAGTDKSKFQFADTTEVCRRNPTIDINFHDQNNMISCIENKNYNSFPFNFIEKTKQIKSAKKAFIINHLKDGRHLPAKPFHEDWITGAILFITILFAFSGTTLKTILFGVSKFFTMRTLYNSYSIESDDQLLHRKSILLNIISFLIIGLFAYCIITYSDIPMMGISGIILWIIAVIIITAAVAIRHIVCMVTGRLSGKREVFKEYIRYVYKSYRLSAPFLLILIALTVYSTILSPDISLRTGIIVLALAYLLRVLRLVLIFIKRNFSIFYLILYLCALEILPVLISVKYITGLI